MIIDSIPGDKSISHRAIIIGSLVTGTTTFKGFLCSDDCLQTLEIFKQLGVEISRFGSTIMVNGVGVKGLKKPQQPLYVGNSGTGIRLISGVLAALPFESTINGDESIQNRPMQRIIDPLSSMGASIQSTNFTPPLIVKGTPNLKSNWRYEMPVASAQVKSSILLAAAAAGQTVTVIEPEPCRDHTERMLTLFGADIKSSNGKIELTSTKLTPVSYDIQIPGDISSALFFICYALMTKQAYQFKNIGLNPSRIGCLNLLQAMGAQLEVIQKEGAYEPMGEIHVKPSPNLKNIDVPLDLVPNLIDELPILAILASTLDGTLRVRGAEELRVKESDRIAGICRLIQAMGGEIIEYSDGFNVKQQTGNVHDFSFDAHFDHRLAMSAFIAAKVHQVQANVIGKDSIPTSFPNFFEILKSVN